MTTKIESSWASSIASIGVSTASGAIIAGPIGGAVALTASIVDECLLHHKITQKHYLTSGIFWSACVISPAAHFLLPQLFWPYKALASLVSVTALSYFSDDFLDFKSKIDLPLGAFMQVNRFFDEKEIFSQKELKKIYQLFSQDPKAALKLIYDDSLAIWNNPFVMGTLKANSLVLLSIAINQFFMWYLAGYAGNMFIFTLINSYKELFEKPASLFFSSTFKNYFLEAGRILLAYIAKELTELWLSKKQSQLQMEQVDLLIDKAAQITLERGRDILSDDQGQEILNYLPSCLWQLMALGVQKLTPVVTETSQFLFALYYIKSFAQEALFPYSLSTLPMQLLLKKISDDSKEASDELSKVTAEVWEMKYEIIKNMEAIGLKDAEKFMEHYHNLLVAKENQLRKTVEKQSHLEKKAQQGQHLFHEMLDVIYFGNKILSQQLDVNQIPLIKNAVNDFTSFLSSNIKVQTEMQDISLAKERIDALFEILAKSSLYEKKAFHTLNDQNAIIYKNYSLFLDGEKLLQFDECRFEIGKNYAITGDSGCGKTSALIDLKIGVHGSLTSSGEISLPLIQDREPKVMFIDQNVYLPAKFTLLEVIYFPQMVQFSSSEELLLLREKIISLFKELEVDEFVWDEKQDKGLVSRLDHTDFKLSGGQLRKIAIIQAIFSQPDILILDETFIGLDAKSIFLLQKALKKYLPHTTILSVDHHAKDNNYLGFYDQEVQFSQKGSCFIPIAAKSLV